MSDKNESLFIEGIANWTKIAQPNTNDKGEIEYTMDVSITDAATRTLLKENGVNIKNKDADLKAKGKPLQGDFVSLKSKFKPAVVDAQLNVLPDSTLIGNGSKVLVKTHAYSWKFKGKSGVSLGLDSVQVLELVTFTKSTLDGFTKREGFIVVQQEAKEESDSPFSD